VLPRLTVFVCSTVKDFKPVRRDLKDWLQRRQIDVRESEDPEFPVALDVHSHAACLRAIQGCHLFVLLVGWRYGGRYGDTKQSITWRECDEARRLDIPVITVILREVNEAAVRYSVAKRSKQPFKEKVDSDHLPDLVRFIDDQRKGRPNNWVHTDWDGSFTGLAQIVDARLNSVFLEYRDPYHTLRRDARRLQKYARARAELDALSQASAILRQEPGTRTRAFLTLLDEHREVLFDFGETDRHNFAVYRLDGHELVVQERVTHADIRRKDRRWRLGTGHVGLACELQRPIVSPDIRFTEDGTKKSARDLENYRSVACVPIRRSQGPIGGVLVVSSSRKDHFRSQEQAEVRTAESAAYILGLMGAVDQPAQRDTGQLPQHGRIGQERKPKGPKRRRVR